MNFIFIQLLDEFSRKQIEIKEEAQPVPDDEPVEKPSDDDEEEEEESEDPLTAGEGGGAGDDINESLLDELDNGEQAESNDVGDHQEANENDDSSSSDSSSESEGEEEDDKEGDNR